MNFAQSKEEKIYFVDLFCGCGGTSSGIHRVNIPGKLVKVIACINHDRNAIISHEANHPDTVHYIEDIRTIDLHPIVKQIQEIRANDMFAKICIWASIECTNFSKAKGGKPRDADSRTLANHLFRYLDCIDPEYLFIENVVEFMAWGEIDENGKPISMDNGKMYSKWVEKIKAYGYSYDYRVLNSADYGVPQSRKRLFIQFAKPNNPIKWVSPTHSKDGMFLPKWKPVKDCLDLKESGKSIFEGKPRSEKTLERVYHGLIKFIAGGEKAFIVKYNSFNATTGKYIPPSLENPSPTISTQGRLAVCHFTSLYYSGRPKDKNKNIEDPSGAITTIDHHSLVNASFISHYHSGNPKSRNKSIDDSANTGLTANHHSIVQPQFIQKYYSTGKNIDSIEVPSATIPTKDRLALVSNKFIYRDFSNGGNLCSLESPSGAVLTNPKLNLVSPEYVLNPQWGVNCSKALDEPSSTIIARQDKTPMYLVSVEYGYALPIYEDDSEWTIKLKEAMIVLGIIDIKMRMFYIKELLKIQDFDENYILVGTQAEQKKYIGNAVPCGVVHKMIEFLFS